MQLKIITGLFLFLMSFSAFPDSYTVVTTTTYSGYSSPQAYCDANYGSGASTANGSGYSGSCHLLSDGSNRQGWSNTIISYSCPSGGTVSGSSCINAPACTAPQVRQTVSPYACAAPSVTCTNGQTKTLLILSGTYPVDGTPPTIVLNHDRTATMEQPLTVSQGGCGYSIPTNPNQNTGCSTSSTGLMYCRVQATQNGSYVSGADTALDGATTQSMTPVPSSNSGCVLNAQGVEICASTNQLNCGTVNGTQICVKDGALQSNGYPASIIDGQVVAQTTNANGQTERCFAGAGGSPTCINPPTTSSCGPGTFFTCLTPETTVNNPSPLTVPISNDPMTQTKVASVTNPDSTRDVTTTTTQDIVGEQPTKTIQHYDASGVLTGTVSSGPLSNGTGSVSGSGSSGTGSNPDNVNLDSAGAAKNKDDFSGIDSVFASGTSALTSLSSGVDASKFLSSPVVPQSSGTTCQVIPMNYKSLHYTFDPCSKLAMFREMFGYLLYVLTAFGIYQIATRQSVNA